jgi:lipoprotein-releasing system ATP-binding protein
MLGNSGLLDTPDAGQVILAGRDMGGLGDGPRTLARRRDLGFIYQFHHLLPEFSALENIVIPQLAAGVSAATLTAAIHHRPASCRHNAFYVLPQRTGSS